MSSSDRYFDPDILFPDAVWRLGRDEPPINSWVVTPQGWVGELVGTSDSSPTCGWWLVRVEFRQTKEGPMPIDDPGPYHFRPERLKPYYQGE